MGVCSRLESGNSETGWGFDSLLFRQGLWSNWDDACLASRMISVRIRVAPPAWLAQWPERLAYIQDVGGSTPSPCTNS